MPLALWDSLRLSVIEELRGVRVGVRVGCAGVRVEVRVVGACVAYTSSGAKERVPLEFGDSLRWITGGLQVDCGWIAGKGSWAESGGVRSFQEAQRANARNGSACACLVSSEHSWEAMRALARLVESDRLDYWRQTPDSVPAGDLRRAISHQICASSRTV